MPDAPYGILSPARLITADQVAKRAAITVRTLQRMVKDGRCPLPVKIGNHRIGFYEREVNDWLENLPRTTELA